MACSSSTRPPWADGCPGSLVGGVPRLGPQAERTSEWINRDGEVQGPPEHEAIVIDALADKRVYEQELTRLRAENEFLGDQVRRVTAELKRLQLRFPSAAQEATTEDAAAGAAGSLDDLPPWVTSSEVMSPLLAAYDARIQDLEGQVSKRKGEMEDVIGRTHKLVEENDQLRREHARELDELVQQTGASGGLGALGAKEIVEELNERINILMAENTVMADQTSEMAKELEAVHQEVEDRDVQMAALTKALSEAGIGLRSLEERLPRLEREKAHAEGELMKAVNALSEREAALSKAGDKLRVYREDITRLSKQVEEMEAEKVGMERQAENDADVTAERVRAAGKRITELQGMLAAKGQEADINGDRVRKLQRELDSTRRDAEGMLQVMSGMERQIAELSAREDSTNATVRESKQKVEDALLARDQARALEIQSRRELARVLETRKADGGEHVREMESAVQAAKHKLQDQLAARDAEIQDLATQMARTRGEAERASRDRAGMEEVYLSLKRGVEKEAEALKSRFDKLKARVLDAEAKRGQQEAKAKELGQAVVDKDRESAAIEAASRGRESYLEDTLRARERELIALRTNLRSATDHAESRQREAERLAVSLEETREEHARKLEEGALMRKAELEEAKAHTSSLEKSARDVERRAGEAEASFVKQLQEARERASAQCLGMERRLREEAELAQRFSARNTDLQAQLAQLVVERGEAATTTKRGLEENTRLEKKLSDARRKLSELTTQLSETIGQVENRAREEGRLRAELKRLQITAARQERETSKAWAGGAHTARLLSRRMRPLAAAEGSYGEQRKAGEPLDRP